MACRRKWEEVKTDGRERERVYKSLEIKKDEMWKVRGREEER